MSFLKNKIFDQQITNSWNKELNLLLGADDWCTIYKCNYEVAPKIKLKSFQIKPNLRAVVMIIVLHGLEITTTDKCTFCDAEKENFSHFFCTCIKVASFWDNVSS